MIVHQGKAFLGEFGAENLPCIIGDFIRIERHALRLLRLWRRRLIRLRVAFCCMHVSLRMMIATFLFAAAALALAAAFALRLGDGFRFRPR